MKLTLSWEDEISFGDRMRVVEMDRCKKKVGKLMIIFTECAKLMSGQGKLMVMK
jgi:hypothetical protein